MRQNHLSPEAPTQSWVVLIGFLAIAAPLAMISWHELSDLLNGARR